MLQKSKAEVFRAMHRGAHTLVLPNAWDAASARIFEHSGFAALATTSAGIAFSLGYSDGQRITRDEMLQRVALIARSVNLPVTADVESGYGPRPEDAAQTAQAVIEAGAIGMNLEDATGNADQPLFELALQVEKIHAVVDTGRKLDVPLVLNARTDVYLAQVGPVETRYDETLRRLSAYRDAGADCLFVPGIRDGVTIGRLARDLSFPLNILVGPGSPSIPELQQLGVARVTVGSSAMRATLGAVQRIAEELKQTGTYRALEGAPSFEEINRMMGAGH
jgi:2-methylisocitrate lyase-like PEP mutase family enzyme